MTDAELIEMAGVQLMPWRRDEATWDALDRTPDTFDAKTGALKAEGKPKGHRDNVQIILERDPYWSRRVYWDELHQRARWDDKVLGAVIEDHDEAEIGLRMHRTYGLSAPTTIIHEALLWKARKDVRHPVREWLGELEWDRVPRLATWAADYLGAEPDPLVAQMARRWMIQAIARAYEPGAKADAVLILQGKQGCGKSTTIAVLGREWYRDTPLDLSSKDRFDSLRGAWIYELAELDSMRRAEAQTLKAFVSSQTDSYRPAYGRNVVDTPRCCVFAGTTNDLQFLQDSTGSRRWWIVPVGQCDVVGLEAVIEQLWAEARDAYYAGEAWHLAKELEEERAVRAEVYELTDPMLQHLILWSDARVDFTTREFWDSAELNKPPGMAEAGRLSALVNKLATHEPGKVNRNGKWVRGYRRKTG